MVKIAVVDDEPVMVEKICGLIGKYMQLEKSIDRFCSGADFFDSRQILFDVVFLDIDIPDINGFEIAENLKFIKPSAVIIFVSNMEHLVFDSLRFSPFRFVRKSSLDADMKDAVEEYERKTAENSQTFFVKTNDLEFSIPVIDMMFFESQGHDLYLKTVDNIFKLKREKTKELSLKTLSEQFRDMGFIRVHKSFLVNYKYIYKIKRDRIVLKDNSEIDMNPHNAPEIRQMYNKLLVMGVDKCT